MMPCLVDINRSGFVCGGGDSNYLCVSRAVANYGGRGLGCQKVIIKFYRSQPEKANEIMRGRCQHRPECAVP